MFFFFNYLTIKNINSFSAVYNDIFEAFKPIKGTFIVYTFIKEFEGTSKQYFESENLDTLIPKNAIVLDATDSVQTKIALAVWANKYERALVMCGAAGGKSDPTSVRCDDLSRTEQDALLAKVRQGLRQDHSFSRNLKRKIGIRAIYSHEPRAGATSGGLACSGYGSTVMVTAACGLAAAAEVLNLIAAQQVILLNPSINP